MNRAWAEVSRGSLVIDSEHAGAEKDCLRLMYYFGSEAAAQPIERVIHLYLGGDVPAGAWPKLAYEALPPRTGFRPDPASYRQLDKSECKPLRDREWAEAKKEVLGDHAIEAMSGIGWRCEAHLAAADGDRAGRSPVFVVYVEPPFPGCRTIEATRKAVHAALGVKP